MTELKIGQQMRDKVTGFAGIAATKTEFLTGNQQFTLQPMAGGLFGRDSQSFDVFQLEYAGAGTPAVEAPEDTGIELGWKVKDIVSGMVGIATLKTTFLNGCIYYTVTPEAAKGAVEIKDVFVEFKRLSKVDTGVAATIAKRTKDVEITGGPSYHVPVRG